MTIQVLIQRTLDAAEAVLKANGDAANDAADYAAAAVIEAGGTQEQAAMVRKEVYDRVL